VTDSPLTVTRRYGDFDELWSSLTGGVGPVGVHAASLGEEQGKAVAGALRRRLSSPAGALVWGGGPWWASGRLKATVGARVNLGTPRRPGRSRARAFYEAL